MCEKIWKTCKMYFEQVSISLSVIVNLVPRALSYLYFAIRSEDMGITGHRHEVLVDYDVSFDSNSGRIVHSKFQCFANAGHSTDLSVAWITILMLRLEKVFHFKFKLQENKSNIKIDFFSFCFETVLTAFPFLSRRQRWFVNSYGLLFKRLDGGYTLTNFNATGKALKTNVPSNTAFRGFGGPEGAIIIEEIIAKMAHLCGLDINKIKEVIYLRK